MFNDQKDIQEFFPNGKPSKKNSKVEPIIKNIPNITAKSFKEFINKPYKPVIDLLSPWMQEASLNMIVAESGAGKTYFCLNVAFALASGAIFLEYRASRPAKILYIDGEMKGAALQARLLSIREHYPNFIQENLDIITPDDMPSFIVPKICQPETQMWLDNLIEKNRYEVIFFDNLSTLSTIDENIAHEWNEIQNWFIRIRARGCTINLVHHTGIETNRQRGSKKREDVLDTVILLKKGHICTNETPLHFNVSYSKHRNFYGSNTLSFDAFMTKDGSWTMKDSITSVKEIVIEYAELKMTQQDIGKALGISQATVCRIIKDAKKVGKL
jgi:hypothetical protein